MSETDESATRAGGCLCGNVRYTLGWPPAMLLTCSCVNCQKQSGGVASIIAVSPRDALDREGELSTYTDRGDSGQDVYRLFCPTCGSAVLTDTPAARKAGIIFVKAGTLDETRGLVPTIHCWTKSKQQWLSFPAGDTIMEKQEGL
jgi:hypothetical protein